MSNREKIILGLMALAILFGAYQFLFTSKKTAGPLLVESQKEDLMAFTQTVSASMGKSSYTKVDAYTISKAAAQWEKDPFLRSPLKVQPEPDMPHNAAETEQPVSPAVSFKYTGYLGLGKVKMAIINGAEYREGDSLEPEGYFIKSINPQQVAIGIKGKEKSITLQLEEPNLPPTKTKS